MVGIKTLTLVFLIAATSVAQNCQKGDKKRLKKGLIMMCDGNNNWNPIVKGRAKPGAPPCEDSISADQCEADRGHCSQYTEAGQKMDVTCSGTCESCDGCRCQDTSQWHKYCPYWAQYCNNPGVLGTWMTANCRKTCNKCKCNCCSYKGKSHKLGQRIPLPDQCGELVCEEGLVAEDSPLLPGAVQHDVSHPEEVTLVFRSLHAGADCCLLENDTMVAEGWSGELTQNGSSFQGICCHGVLSMPIKDITISKPPDSTSTTPTTSTTTMAPTITTTLTTTTTIITDQYLYLSDSKIVSLPSFAEVTTCNQEFPEKPLSYASAGVVTVNGKKELQVCGGTGMSTCQLWTEDGWVETATGFNRNQAGASTVGGSLIITGGWDRSTRKRLSSSMIYKEDDGWEEYTSLPVATYRHCQVTVGDSVYVVGGSTDSGRTGDTYRLSLSSKQWVKQSSLNTPRYDYGCAEWDGGVLVVGGYGSGGYLSSVEKYNPVSNKWFLFTPLPTKLQHTQVLVWDNDLYVFGGQYRNNFNKKVYKLKKGEETWETLGLTLENTDYRPVFPVVTLSTIHCN